MKRAIAAVAVCLAALPVRAQDAEALVARAIEAQGGREAWAAVETLRLAGTYSRFSTPQPFVLLQKRPNRYRFDHVLLDYPITLGYDGERAWWVNTSPISPVPWAIEPPAAYVQVIEADSEIGGPLLNSETRGHRVETNGLVDLEGEELWELLVTLKNGAVERWYLDPETFLPRTRLSTGADGPMAKPRRSDFYDYREVAGGIRIAHRVEVEVGYNFEVMEVQEAEVNVEVEDEKFQMPLSEGMEALRGLVGRYKVAYESRPDPGVPIAEPGELEVEVRSAYGGTLLEEELTYPMFSTPRRVKRWRSWDRFQEVYRTTLFDSMTGHIDVLEGRFGEDGRLVVSDVGTGTSWTAHGRTYHTREVTYGIGPEGFQVDLETSFDGGETWVGKVSFVYSRISESP